MQRIKPARQITGVHAIKKFGIDHGRLRAAQTWQLFMHMLVHRQGHRLHGFRGPVTVMRKVHRLPVTEFPKGLGHVQHIDARPFQISQSARLTFQPYHIQIAAGPDLFRVHRGTVWNRDHQQCRILSLQLCRQFDQTGLQVVGRASGMCQAVEFTLVKEPAFASEVHVFVAFIQAMHQQPLQSAAHRGRRQIGFRRREP